ncbi:hypothetical protein T03_10913 [Trichinella britovi]|uniref:Uncharacterized protein n=1 Tax=Trichinella britovi TaxID=45882 RepID=A0A0V1DGT3_TRIBR|nr:hypothetical protein T03_10913 [Trichinella britovi]
MVFLSNGNGGNDFFSLCKDPPGGAGGSASWSALVCQPSLCALSVSLSRRRLLVNILATLCLVHFRTTDFQVGRCSSP